MTKSNIQPDVNPQTIPGFVLWQLSKLWQRKLNTALKPLGIGSTEFVLLGNVVRLSQLNQTTTPAALIAETKVDRMTTSQTLRSLARKKLIEKTSAFGDKRTFLIVPTPNGVRLADEALGKVITAHGEFFAPIQGQTESFLAHMLELIERNDRENKGVLQ